MLIHISGIMCKKQNATLLFLLDGFQMIHCKTRSNRAVLGREARITRISFRIELDEIRLHSIDELTNFLRIGDAMI